MARSLRGGLGFNLCPLFTGIEGLCWSSPCCLPRVMINVVCPAELILSALPACRQTSLSIFERAETSSFSSSTGSDIWNRTC